MATNTNEQPAPKPQLLTSADPTVLRIIPDLAAEIGDGDESVILLQVAFWVKIGGKFIDGKWWIWKSAADMHTEAFKWMTPSTINRKLNKLVGKGFLFEDKFNEKKYDRTRWFALNLDKLAELSSIHVVLDGQTYTPTQTQNASRQTQNAKPIPEITTETTTKKKKKTPTQHNTSTEEDVAGETSSPERDVVRRHEKIEIIEAWHYAIPSHLTGPLEIKKWLRMARKFVLAGYTAEQVRAFVTEHYKKHKDRDFGKSKIGLNYVYEQLPAFINTGGMDSYEPPIKDNHPDALLQALGLRGDADIQIPSEGNILDWLKEQGE